MYRSGRDVSPAKDAFLCDVVRTSNVILPLKKKKREKKGRKTCSATGETRCRVKGGKEGGFVIKIEAET